MRIKPLFFRLSLLTLTLICLVLPVAAQSNANQSVITPNSSLPYIFVKIAVVLGGAIVLHYLLGQLKHRLLAIAYRHTGTQTTDDEVHVPLELFLKLLVGAARLSLWIGVALYFTHLFPATRR
jgi:hypothetical protein